MFAVIDGSALMCVQYYGSLPEEIKYAKTPEEKDALYEQYLPHTKDGTYTNGLNGFFSSLLGLLCYQGVEHIAVCFDRSRESTFRKQIYPEYKAQRQETPFPLAQQMHLAKQLTRRLGITVLESPEFEADDYAGTLAKTFESQEPVMLLTKDRDYFQLLSDNTHAWISQPLAKLEVLREKYGNCPNCPPGYHEYTPEIVYSEIGVRVDQITDWKGLSGDPSDNLPGVKGVADKSALPLLKEYGSMEGIYRALDACNTEADRKALAAHWKEDLGILRPPIKALMENREMGFLCKQLAEIKTDVPIDAHLEAYESPADFYPFVQLAEEFHLEYLQEMIDNLSRMYDEAAQIQDNAAEPVETESVEEYSQDEPEF